MPGGLLPPRPPARMKGLMREFFGYRFFYGGGDPA
jgi:hypothetical protein